MSDGLISGSHFSNSSIQQYRNDDGTMINSGHSDL